MKTIFKYLLNNGRNSLDLSKGAEILTCQYQHGNLYLWAIVDTEALLKSTRIINVYGTGHEITPEGTYKYISTVQEHGGNLVWHVFERFQ